MYTHNDDNTYDVTLDDNYNWYDLVYAIQENKVASCVLWDEGRVYPMFLTAFAPSLDDGYVVFSALNEGGGVYELYVDGGGGLSLSYYAIATREYVDNASGGEVTAETIESALGYTPADKRELEFVSDDTSQRIAALQTAVSDCSDLVNDFNQDISELYTRTGALAPIVSTTDITAGSAAPNGRPYHVIE